MTPTKGTTQQMKVQSQLVPALKRMMMVALALPSSRLRSVGLTMAMVGFAIVWLVR